MRFQIGENFVEGIAVVPPVSTVYDPTPNDSNKSWVVPDGERWKVNWAKIILATTATVGNRQAELLVKDTDGNVVFSTKAGAVQGASTTRTYHFMQHTAREAAFVAAEILTPISANLWLPAGFTLQLWDSSAVDAAADDMTVSFQVEKYKGA